MFAGIVLFTAGAALPTVVSSAVSPRDVPVSASTAGTSAGLVTRWRRPIGDAEVVLDARSASLALVGLDAGFSGRNPIEVVDTRTGVSRWTGTTAGTPVRDADWQPAVTAGGLALLATPTTVEAVDLATGRTAWATRPGSGANPALHRDLLRQHDLVLLETGDGADARDAESGSPRWNWRHHDCIDQFFAVVTGTDEPTIRCGAAVTRLRPADGTERWSRRSPAGCALVGTVGGTGFVALAETCGNVPWIRVLDAATGRERWSRTTPWETDDLLRGAEGLSAVTAGTTTLLLTGEQPDVLYRASDGTVVLLPTGSGPLPPSGTTQGGTTTDGLIAARADGRTTTLTMIDTVTGAARWTREVPFPEVGPPLRTPEGVLLFTGAAPPLWPDLLARVDEDDGGLTLSATGGASAGLIGTGADGTLLVETGAHGRKTIAALAPGVAADGFLDTPVAAGRWPDACALLTAADHQAAYRGARPVMRPEPVLGMPVPVGCRLLPPSMDGTTVTTVGWLAADDTEASAAATAQDRSGRAPEPVRLGAAGRPGWTWTGDEYGDDEDRNALSAAVGRCVVTVRTFGDGGPLRRLGGVVVDRLAADPVCAAGRSR